MCSNTTFLFWAVNYHLIALGGTLMLLQSYNVWAPMARFTMAVEDIGPVALTWTDVANDTIALLILVLYKNIWLFYSKQPNVALTNSALWFNWKCYLRIKLFKILIQRSCLILLLKQARILLNLCKKNQKVVVANKHDIPVVQHIGVALWATRYISAVYWKNDSDGAKISHDEVAFMPNGPLTSSVCNLDTYLLSEIKDLFNSYSKNMSGHSNQYFCFHKTIDMESLNMD